MREEIIKMAREAGAGEPESLYGRTDYVVMTRFELERFLHMAQASERESCAKVADEFDPQMKMSNYGQVIANRIRARGQA